MYVNKCVLGQLPQPWFTSAKKEPQCPCISINKDRSFYCVPNYRKIPSQPVKACYSYLISGGTRDRQARKQASLATNWPNQRTIATLPVVEHEVDVQVCYKPWRAGGRCMSEMHSTETWVFIHVTFVKYASWYKNHQSSVKNVLHSCVKE
jgi:hypothetical protein